MTIQERCDQPADFADDGRQRRRDDGLVERGEQQHERQRREYREPAAMLLVWASGSASALVRCMLWKRANWIMRKQIEPCSPSWQLALRR